MLAAPFPPTSALTIFIIVKLIQTHRSHPIRRDSDECISYSFDGIAPSFNQIWTNLLFPIDLLIFVLSSYHTTLSTEYKTLKGAGRIHRSQTSYNIRIDFNHLLEILKSNFISRSHERICPCCEPCIEILLGVNNFQNLFKCGTACLNQKNSICFLKIVFIHVCRV